MNMLDLIAADERARGVESKAQENHTRAVTGMQAIDGIALTPDEDPIGRALQQAAIAAAYALRTHLDRVARSAEKQRQQAQFALYDAAKDLSMGVAK